jgi:protein-disulfide isomerase
LPESVYLPLLSVIFAHQSDWLFLPEHLFALFASLGISQEDRKTLLKNSTLSKALLFRRFEEEERLNLSAVPSFVINGKVYEGTLSLSQLEEAIDGK